MNREKCKILLERGIFQAFAEGKKVAHRGTVWEDMAFDDEPHRYEILPNLSPGDLVYHKGNPSTVGVVQSVYLAGNVIVKFHDGYTPICNPNHLIKVKRVLKPHTFETAVKACAEHGIRLSKGIDERVLLGLHTSKCYWVSDTSGISVQGSSDYEALCTWVFFSNNTPFAQVTYKDIT